MTNFGAWFNGIGIIVFSPYYVWVSQYGRFFSSLLRLPLSDVMLQAAHTAMLSKEHVLYCWKHGIINKLIRVDSQGTRTYTYCIDCILCWCYSMLSDCLMIWLCQIKINLIPLLSHRIHQISIHVIHLMLSWGARVNILHTEYIQEVIV